MLPQTATVRPSFAVSTALLLATLSLPTRGGEHEKAVRAVEVLRTTQTWSGAPIAVPQGRAEIIGFAIEIAPGGETGWHSHPVPSFAYVLSGTLEVTLANGTAKRVRSGEAFAEVIDTSHNGRNVGPDPVKLVVFYTASPGQPVTARAGR